MPRLRAAERTLPCRAAHPGRGGQGGGGRQWQEILEDFQPDADTLRASRAVYLGSYWHLFRQRAELVRSVQSSDFYGWAFFDGIGMMLIGMGLVRLGVGQAARAPRALRSLRRGSVTWARWR